MLCKSARLFRYGTPALAITTGYTLHQHTRCDAVNSSGQHSKNISSFTYPANHPTEDRHIYGKSNDWNYAAVFDGHGGWQVAEFAAKNLPEVITKNMPQISTLTETEIDNKLIQSFQETEDLIIQSIRPAFRMGFGEVGHVGSCVLFAIQKSDHLVVANCGDCRAVLGSVSNDTAGKAEVVSTQINREHNCRVPLEQVILTKQHPNESNLIVCKSERACYVKGRLQLTRSLGDVYLKYHEFNGTGIPGARVIPEPYTPPYVSHVPDVHHIKLEKSDQFVILGTDGLWDYLSDDEAVQIVHHAMKNHRSQEQIASLLVERALAIAAGESFMTLEQLYSLPPGRQRRGRHDDTTAVVLFLNK